MAFGGIFDIAGIRQRIEELEQISADPDFWTDKKRSTTLLREKSSIERVLQKFSALEDNFEDADTLYQLAEEENDLETLAEAKAGFIDIEKEHERGKEILFVPHLV